jgi:5-carboxymethyl-2-hydroxymuconate isomerase
MLFFSFFYLYSRRVDMKNVRLSDGSETPVGKIICLARNYSEHAKELGNEVPSSPVLFMKPATSIIHEGEKVVIPAYSQNCHYEVELAVLIGKEGKDIQTEDAMSYVDGYGVAIDMTLRDVQNSLKKDGFPWEIAKGFDTSCPLSPFVPASTVTDPHSLPIWLKVNGKMLQDGNTDQMMRTVPEIIAAASESFTLEAGDILLTGTPAGVGQVVSGDLMECGIDGVGTLSIAVA